MIDAAIRASKGAAKAHDMATKERRRRWWGSREATTCAPGFKRGQWCKLFRRGKGSCQSLASARAVKAEQKHVEWRANLPENVRVLACVPDLGTREYSNEHGSVYQCEKCFTRRSLKKMKVMPWCARSGKIKSGGRATAESAISIADFQRLVNPVAAAKMKARIDKSHKNKRKSPVSWPESKRRSEVSKRYLKTPKH